MCTSINNKEKNGIELYFDGKPAAEVIAALKAACFRWHSVKKCWYSKATEAAQALAAKLAEGNSTEAEQNADRTAEQTASKKVQRKKALASLWERTRTDDLPSYGRDRAENKQRLAEAGFPVGGANSYDKQAAAYMRKHLRERFPECKISVTSGGAGWLDSVNIAIKAAPWEKKPYTYDECGRYTDNNADELKTVLKYCEALHSSFDADDGDHYADYGAHHDLYGSASIAYDYKQTEATPQTEADRADFAKQKAAFEKAEAERAEREYLEEMKRREAEQKATAIAEQKAAETVRAITEFVRVEDLTEAEQIAACGLLESSGKDASIAEATDNAAKRNRTADFIITRKIHFNACTEEQTELYNAFCNMLLYDFDFLAGFGGSGTEDIRVTEDNFQKLTAEQRNGVHWFNTNSIGVYLNGVLKFVIDTQGYNYSRYVGILPEGYNEAEQIRPAQEYRAEWRRSSEQLKPFYIPRTVAEQTETAQIETGETVTVLRVDGFTSQAEQITGTVESVKIANYSQRENALYIEILPWGKRNTIRRVIHRTDAAVFRGTIPTIPDELKYRNVDGSDVMREVLFAGANARQFLINVIEWLEQYGIAPIIDTVQR